jgi:hypothetical protein
MVERTENAVVTLFDAILSRRKRVADSRSGEGPMGDLDGAARGSASSRSSMMFVKLECNCQGGNCRGG